MSIFQKTTCKILRAVQISMDGFKTWQTSKLTGLLPMLFSNFKTSDYLGKNWIRVTPRLSDSLSILCLMLGSDEFY